MNIQEERNKQLEDLQKATDKFGDLLDRYPSLDTRTDIQNRIDYLNVCEMFDIDFGKTGYVVCSNFTVGDFGRVLLGPTITWSDDGKQPKENEYLYMLSFPTGAYIFGDHYPEELFREMFKELCEYDPKYKDTANKNLYFSPENAKNIHADIDSILVEYRRKDKEYSKQRRKEELEAELEKLNSGQ